MGAELENAKIEVYEMEGFSDSELVYYVRDALRSVPLGEADRYNQLIGVVHHTERLTPEEVALLVTSLKALSGAVSCVDVNYHESLLASIFRMSMWNYIPDVMDALMEFIIILAATNGKYIDSCLEMLVSNFTPPPSFLSVLSQPRGILRKSQVLERVHSVLKEITELIPLAPLRLLPIVLDRMPKMHTKDAVMAIYVENMLRLEGSAIGEQVGSTVLMAIVDRLIDLDVEIGWDDILQDDCTKGIFDMEVEDLDDIVDDDETGVPEFTKESLSKKCLGVNSFAEKLDSLMVLTFEHLKSCHDNGRLMKVFETLLQSFQITVLNAYKSKFAQFVMFYACSLEPEICGVQFATALANNFCCSSYPPLTRMSAVAYLASFLSRGSFLPDYLISSMLKRLVDWCYDYGQRQEGEVNLLAHRIFYSGCQAVMYVLCFRMRLMMDIPRLKSQLLLMPIESILKHPLYPLKVCLPSVVSEFLRQAKTAKLFTVSESFIFDDLLESDLSKTYGGIERLDMFFPFDPCLLKKCDRPKFLYWTKVRTTYDDGEEDSSGEEGSGSFLDAEVDSLSDDEMEGSAETRYLSEFNESLDRMSITPKQFKVKFSFGDDSIQLQKMPSRLRPSMSPE